jgi:hypothetical protein
MTSRHWQRYLSLAGENTASRKAEMAFVIETARPPVFAGSRFWPRRPLDLMSRLQKFGRRA